MEKKKKNNNKNFVILEFQININLKQITVFDYYYAIQFIQGQIINK